MCDSVLLWMTLYFTVWLCLTLEDSIGHCMTLHDPVCLCITLYDSEWFWITLLESVSLILTVFWFFSYCFIPFNCLNLFKMFNSVRKCSTHAVMNKFWACQLNMFRMIQNGAKWIKWFKKAQKEFTVFKLCLRNLDFVSSYAPMHKFCACLYMLDCWITIQHYTIIVVFSTPYPVVDLCHLLPHPLPDLCPFFSTFCG